MTENTDTTSMKPLMMDLSDARVLIFGNGTVAQRKAAFFSGCSVDFLSRSNGCDVAKLAEDELTALISPYDIVIAALSDAELNESVCSAAKKCGKLYNSATAVGNFLIPASFKEGDVTVAVSTNGKAPGLAAAIRNDMKYRYPHLAESVLRNHELRTNLKETEPDEEKRAELIKSAAQSELNESMCISLASFDYTTHDQKSLSALRFDEEAFFAAADFKGVVLLQTCNRVEILVHDTAFALKKFLKEQNRENYALFENEEVLLHLSQLASGTESLIVGEDQILGQLKNALLLAEKYGASDDVTKACISVAINLGVTVRQKTCINRGAVSIGSAAVQLAEKICGDLSGRNILVVGGGEMGRLVTKSLAEKNLRAIYVTNRTYENAVTLAKEVNGRAMHMDQFYPCAALSDIVISCTAAPHEIIRAEPLAEVMENRFWPLDESPRPLILIDIANPCDVEKSCSEIPGVRLFTIDDLKEISEENMSQRRNESRRAEELIAEFQPEFVKIIKRTASEKILAGLYSWAAEIRMRETQYALDLLDRGKNPKEVIAGLTKSLTNKLLDDASAAIRKSAEENSLDEAEKFVNSITGGK